jgi:general secretion pathway protein G
MRTAQRRSHSGFSLLELVIVIVIIGLIAAIAIPRFSCGTAGAADTSLEADLAILRNAIDLFAAEHGGDYPTLAKITDQLTKYTDGLNTSDPVDARDVDHPYGPYLRAIPALPVGDNKGKTDFTAGSIGDGDVGWWYDQTNGVIKANCDDAEKDNLDKQYNAY